MTTRLKTTIHLGLPCMLAIMFACWIGSILRTKDSVTHSVTVDHPVHSDPIDNTEHMGHNFNRSPRADLDARGAEEENDSTATAQTNTKSPSIGDSSPKSEPVPPQTVPPASFDALRGLDVGDTFGIALPGRRIEGKVDSALRRAGLEDYGVTLNGDAGRLVVSLQSDRLGQAYAFFKGESKVLGFSRAAVGEEWTLEESTVSEVLCAPPGTTYPFESGGGFPTDPAEPSLPPDQSSAVTTPPIFNSLPGADHVIYIDLDGEEVTHPRWNKGETIYALPHAQANDASWVKVVWQRVAEDFIPFNINVTTDRRVYDAAAIGQRVHCIVTPTKTARPGSGGVAYVNSYPFDIPCWIFNSTEYAAADTIAHEVGHTVGLRHDGRTLDGATDTYYGGHGSGETSWAPIMGASWSDDGARQYDNVTQWSKGEYQNANNLTDDLAIITRLRNGFGYRPDDLGNSADDASALQMTGAVVLDSGIIESNDDEDWYRFVTGGGGITIKVDSLDVMSSQGQRGSSTDGANLAVSLDLYDAAGNLFASDNPLWKLGAAIRHTVTAGTYFIRVAGAGRGTADTGFTRYASLGQYTVTGTIPPPNQPPQPEVDVLSSIDFPGLTNVVVLSGNGLSAEVVLDAARTTDPDGDALRFEWSVGGRSVGSESVLVADLELGTHVISLVVSDTFSQVETSVVIDVISLDDSVGIVLGLVEAADLGPRNTRPLNSSLLAAAASFERGNAVAAVNQLHAFQRKVLAQVSLGHPEAAMMLLAAAELVIDVASAG